ncbi:MAG: hypothetical protein CMJ48_07985 [Planctomycetaceae bacterium]|nr:hypothetical protein [Planctomycetaceae bacterium]
MRILTAAVLTILVFSQMADVSFAQNRKGGRLGDIFGRDEEPEEAKEPESPEERETSEKNKPKDKRTVKELTLVERIDQLKLRVASAEETRRQDVRPSKSWKEIRQRADKLAQHVQKIRQNDSGEANVGGPRGAPREMAGWKKRFRDLNKAMSEATKRIRELEAIFGKANTKPGGYAIREMSVLLFKVNLAGSRLVLEELRWERELSQPALEIEVASSRSRVDLHYTERHTGEVDADAPEARPGDAWVGRWDWKTHVHTTKPGEPDRKQEFSFTVSRKGDGYTWAFDDPKHPADAYPKILSINDRILKIGYVEHPEIHTVYEATGPNSAKGVNDFPYGPLRRYRMVTTAVGTRVELLGCRHHCRSQARYDLRRVEGEEDQSEDVRADGRAGRRPHQVGAVCGQHIH